mmetsp:Transcript_82130/g.171945  ORF Transcript_82130/g.171945 Transcript_82130/m.171945 type:complete len:396 (+) Transcript_82130:1057-2244(+)
MLRQALHHGHNLGPAEVGASLELKEGIALGHSARAGLLQDLLGLGQCLELLRSGGQSLLMVSSNLHAGGLSGLKGRSGISQVLLGHLEVACGSGLCLLSCGLGGLLLLEILVVGCHLVLKGLLHHLEVVLAGGLSLAQLAQLALGLLLQVLEHVHDAAALALVDGRLGGLEFHVVLLLVSLALALALGLHEGSELLLVGARERSGIQHVGQSRDHVGESTLGSDLCQHGWVLGHFLFQDACGSLESLDNIYELGIASLEVGLLLLPNQGGILQLTLCLSDGSDQVRNLVCGNGGVAGQLSNLSIELGDLLAGRVDGELAVFRSVVAPLDVLVVGGGFRLSLLGHLSFQGAQELQHLAQWVGIGHGRGTVDEGREGRGEDALGKLHCSGHLLFPCW